MSPARTPEEALPDDKLDALLCTLESSDSDPAEVKREALRLWALSGGVKGLDDRLVAQGVLPRLARALGTLARADPSADCVNSLVAVVTNITSRDQYHAALHNAATEDPMRLLAEQAEKGSPVQFRALMHLALVYFGSTGSQELSGFLEEHDLVGKAMQIAEHFPEPLRFGALSNTFGSAWHLDAPGVFFKGIVQSHALQEQLVQRGAVVWLVKLLALLVEDDALGGPGDEADKAALTDPHGHTYVKLALDACLTLVRLTQNTEFHEHLREVGVADAVRPLVGFRDKLAELGSTARSVLLSLGELGPDEPTT